jgi:lipid-binding SYLF domain-containing protein
MMQYEVRDSAALVAYLTDCTLATVCGLSMKKSASKSETERQIAIAQFAINRGLDCGVSFKGTRAQQVIDRHAGNVQEWADTYRPFRAGGKRVRV